MCEPNCKHHEEIEQLVFGVANRDNKHQLFLQFETGTECAVVFNKLKRSKTVYQQSVLDVFFQYFVGGMKRADV